MIKTRKHFQLETNRNQQRHGHVAFCVCFYVIIFTLQRFIFGGSTAFAQQDIARQAYLIFQQSCLGCHGEHGAFREDLIIEHTTLIDSGIVIPRNPDTSEFYKRLIEDTPEKPQMPLLQPALTSAALTTIRAWIAAGAPNWEVQHDINFITTDAMLTAMQNHLRTLDSFDRPSTRYFTMTHLYNAGENREALRAYRVALSKLVNSLSWGFEIINPQPIDAAETVFYIDLRDYEWDIRGNAWTQIEAKYPYNIAFDASTQAGHLEKLTDLQQEMNCEVPFVHVDWFLATASLPPLYHDILDLPLTEHELERELGINVVRNIQMAPGVRVWRAGTNNSGVSNHNRVVERHTARYGAYWKSHDFAGSAGTQNIFTHPLSFKRDGGEVIFNLPNGLQGYYISDGFGNRIDVAPTAIVSNPAASDPAVRNGLSCIGCHTEGMKKFEDSVRSFIDQTANPPYDKDQALRLYVEKHVMDTLVEQDTARYKSALEATGGVFGGIEPVHRFHEAFQRPLEAPYAAAAVGMETEAFLEKIDETPSLQNLGLTGLLSGGNVKRDVWESHFLDLIACLYGNNCPTPEPIRSVDPIVPRTRLIPDPNLRAAVAETLGKAPGASITVADLTRLTHLSADARGIRDLRGLEHATKLRGIELRHNAIVTLSPLVGLTQLNYIELRGNRITDVSPLADLINVDWLGLEENAITDLSPLKRLVKLKGIGIEGNPVSDVSPLAGTISLEGLNARRTAISNFSALAKLPRLRWIEFGHDTSIGESPSLKGLQTLRRLEIRNAGISDISGLAELTQLQSLTLRDNSISDLSALANLKALTHLNLESNLVSDISALKGLTRLKTVELTNNLISDVSPLAGLTNLERLDLRNNAISDFSPLNVLSDQLYIHSENNPGVLKQGGPKITGPWLWVLLPGTRFDDFRSKDLLAGASGRKVTELQIATDGAAAGESVGNSVWRSHKISATGWNNVSQMLKALGTPAADGSENVVYGSIILDSPREQKTKMFVGSGANHKVWLNGELVNEDYHTWHVNYEKLFPATLKQGKNVLLVSIHNWDHQLNGHFGFAPDTEYTVLSAAQFSLSTDTTQIRKGETFTLRLNVANITDFAGWQTDITFDPAVLKANRISEGDFLKQAGGQTYFQKGTIQNKRGKIIGLSAARTSQGSASGQGTLVSIRFTALANGETRLTLRNFQAGSSTGKPISSPPIEIFIVVGGQPAAPAFVPETTTLRHNYPNPFNPETWIPYQLAEPANVTLRIYATDGALVRTLAVGYQSAGRYQQRSRAAYWDGRNEIGEPVASGVYFYTLTAGDFTATRKMSIQK